MKIIKKLFKIGFWCAIFTLFAVLGVNIAVKYYANRYCYSYPKNLPDSPVAIVFGAGLYRNNQPSNYLKDRLDKGIELYEMGKVKKLLLSGDNGRDEYDEITVMKEYCTQHKVDSADIYLDYAGFDTYSTIYRAKNIFKIDSAILISQNYHLDRAIMLGRQKGLTVFGAVADKQKYGSLRRNKAREYLAVIKSIIDLKRNRKPRFLGETVDIRGISNYTKE
jgi:SanA protein